MVQSIARREAITDANVAEYQDAQMRLRDMDAALTTVTNALLTALASVDLWEQHLDDTWWVAGAAADAQQAASILDTLARQVA